MAVELLVRGEVQVPVGYIALQGYDREGSKTTLFPGDAESKFSKWLKKTCEANN